MRGLLDHVSLKVVVLIGAYAVGATVSFIWVSGSHIVGCLGLEPARNAACQAAAVARLPWLDQFLGTPMPWLAGFLAASIITVIWDRKAAGKPR
jgi:hypothetical protein